MLRRVERHGSGRQGMPDPGRTAACSRPRGRGLCQAPGGGVRRRSRMGAVQGPSGLLNGRMSDDTDTIDVDLAAAEEAEGRDALLLALDAFEGPLALLLELARAKKIDIAKVSVGEIADQYLAFIAEAHAQNMELASDYLVMAAWLALLKSRLLLPKPHLPEDEPDPHQIADALRLKLMRLELARAAAKRLDAAPQLGRD